MSLDGSLRWGGTPSKTDFISRSCYPRCSWNVHGHDPPQAHVSILRGDVAEGAPWLEPVEIEVWRRACARSWLHAWLRQPLKSCSFDRLRLEAQKIFFTVVVSNENNRQFGSTFRHTHFLRYVEDAYALETPYILLLAVQKTPN